MRKGAWQKSKMEASQRGEGDTQERLGETTEECLVTLIKHPLGCGYGQSAGMEPRASQMLKYPEH